MKTQIPAPVLRSPHHLLAAVPFLLGFRPQASVVVVWIRSGVIALTQRVDWPVQASHEELATWAEAVVRPARHVCAQGAVILGYPPSHIDAVDSQGALPLVWLGKAIKARETEVLDVLLVLEDGWKQVHLESGSVAEEISLFNIQVLAEVSDDFMFSGWSFAASRDDVCAEFEPQPGAALALVEDLEQLAEEIRSLESAELELWRDEVIRLLLNCCESGVVASADRLRLANGLRDIRVRDSVLWHLAHQLDPNTSFLAVRALIRCLPEGQRAPAATVGAICAWLTGDGVRATAALDIAAHEEPEYGLARLVSTALANGLPPRMWQETMEQLTYDSCRNGLS
ncbi:MAG: DUF4192 domain-containing protein [Actinomycetota bacterium]|nr:DUF4192 domain-containing protein [Actinomycetota bacterium]